jgi:hypothetical protein
LVLRLAAFARFFRNSSFGADLQMVLRDLATNIRSALGSLSASDVHRLWQPVSRFFATTCQAFVSCFESHLRDHFNWVSSSTFKSALTSLSVPERHRYWQKASRVYPTDFQAFVSWLDIHPRDHFNWVSSWLAGISRGLALTLGAMMIVLVTTITWFGFRWWRNRSSSSRVRSRGNAKAQSRQPAQGCEVRDTVQKTQSAKDRASC